jgi:hypothetical protein
MPFDRSPGVLGAALLLLSSASCVYGPAKVAQGQLYRTGNPDFDGYFQDVHQQQVDAATWDDDEKTARKPLATALELPPDAPDVSLVQGTYEASTKVAKQPGSLRLDLDGTNVHVSTNGGASDSPVFRGVEDSSHQELERAKKLHAVEPKIDALVKQGNDLTGKVKDAFAKYGPTRQNEVTSELNASIAALSALKTRVQSEARGSEDFVADLERALETASEDKAAKVARRARRKRDDSSPARVSVASKPAPPPADPAPSSAKPAAPPKPADPGEVFNP